MAKGVVGVSRYHVNVWIQFEVCDQADPKEEYVDLELPWPIKVDSFMVADGCEMRAAVKQWVDLTLYDAEEDLGDVVEAFEEFVRGKEG